MKIRSSLLVACIVVVPLIAMFSHRIPAGARSAVGTLLRDLVGAAGSAPARSRTFETSPAPGAVAPPAREAGATGFGSPPPAAGGPPVVPLAALPPVDARLDRLRQLGAVALDCRPLPGGGGHVASCRLPVDESGQLERVFQASGADAVAAADNLLRDVTAWRGAAEPAPDPERETLRF